MLDKYGRMAWAFASPKTILEYDIYQIYTKYIPNMYQISALGIVQSSQVKDEHSRPALCPGTHRSQGQGIGPASSRPWVTDFVYF